MTFAVLEVSLEEAEPVFQLSRCGGVGQDQLAELGVESLVTRYVVDDQGEEGVHPVWERIPIDVWE